MLSKVYKLSASWCFPCKMYAPTFKKVSEIEKYKNIEFKEIESDDDEEPFIKYKVMSVPTTLFLDENDREITRVMGNIPQGTLINKIDELL